MALQEKNSHPRDKNISFDESTHTYTVNGDSNYTSVTTLIHSFFPSFDAELIISKMMNPQIGKKASTLEKMPRKLKKNGMKQASPLPNWEQKCI